MERGLPPPPAKFDLLHFPQADSGSVGVLRAKSRSLQDPSSGAVAVAVEDKVQIARIYRQVILSRTRTW